MSQRQILVICLAFLSENKKSVTKNLEFLSMYVNLQMNYILTRKDFPKPLLENLPQRNTALCDLKLVFDNGEVWIHRTVLQMWQVWWSSLLQDSKTNIVLLPGVSKVEVEHFLSNVYRGKLNFSLTDDSDDENESFYGFTDMEIAESKRLKPIASYWRPWQETRTNAGGEQGEVAMEKIRPIEHKLKISN